MNYETNVDKDKLAELAGQMTGMHMEAIAALQEYGLTWQDVAFAAMVSIKALARMHDAEDDELTRIVAVGMAQPVMGKRFESEEEATEWMQNEGLAPSGPTH